MSSGFAWLILFVAGLCEVGWAVGLKYTEGFSRLVPSVLTLFCMAASVGMRDDGKGPPARHFIGQKGTGRRFGSKGEVGHQRACGRESGRNQGVLQGLWAGSGTLRAGPPGLI